MERRGNYLFSVDLEQIPRMLEEANISLVDRLKAKLIEVSHILSVDGNPPIVELKLAYKEMISLKKEFATTRLSDGRPFSEATKAVKIWFEHFEREIQAGIERIQSRMDRLIVNQSESVSIGNSLAEQQTAESMHGGTADSEIVWVVESFDRRSLDMEALRNHLTDYAIESALTKRLKETGMPNVSGVKYKKTARL